MTGTHTGKYRSLWEYLRRQERDVAPMNSLG